MKASTDNTAIVERFVKPAIPIVIVLLLLFALTQDKHPPVFAIGAVFVVCGIVLWLGWGWVRRNVVAKLVGVVLTAYLVLILGLLALGIALRIGLVLLLLFLVALPFLVYDLFFRQPHKGRFARARAARRGLPM